MISPEEVDWSTTTDATYRIEQTLRYEYPNPITDLRHRLVIVPRVRHGDQSRLAHNLTASPDTPLALEVDQFGNDVAYVVREHVAQSITFELSSLVRRSLADRQPKAERHVAPLYWADRRLVRPDRALRDAAADLRRAHPDPHERAEAIVHFVHDRFTYTKGITDVFTTAAVAFQMGRGVCQDYAHVAIALARASGLTARYISGHMIGESATHAWVEFLHPADDGTISVESFDPTRRARTSLRYVTIAIGRDYEDVAPTSGVFTGCCSGKLDGQQRVVLLEALAA